MRKVMLVDDEYMLLRGLKLLIDWQSLGLEIVNTEQSPILALKYLQDNPIDILLSDMNMPEMAGPEFVAAAKQLQPAMELIVISGYSDFDYVRAGLQQNAVNYLRKPIDTDELLETLQGTLTRIEARQQNNQIASLAAQTQTRTLVTTDNRNERDQMVTALGIDFERECDVRLIGVLNPLPPKDLVNYLRVLTMVKGFYTEGQDYIILFQGTTAQLNVFINEAPHQIGVEHRPFLVSAAIKDSSEVSRRYVQLRHEITRQYFFETAAGLRIMLSDSQQTVGPTLPGYSEVKTALDGTNLETFKTWLTEQFEVMKRANASDVLARQFALVVLLVLSDRLTKFDEKASVIASINHAQGVSALKHSLMQVAALMTTTGTQQFSRNVVAMRKIIQERYPEQLSLAMVASELHLNPVYLGQSFKQEVGRSFAKFLNDYRVDVAVDLLRDSDQDIGQIAEVVGYQNSSYFYKQFKKQTGMSPGDYRKAGVLSN